MISTHQQLWTSALALPEADRLELGEALLASSEPPAPALTGDAWLSELNRRSDELDAGSAEFTSWSEVKKRVRAVLVGPTRQF